MNPGSIKTLISKKVVPRMTNPTETGSQNIHTLAGTMETTEMVYLHNLHLP